MWKIAIFTLFTLLVAIDAQDVCLRCTSSVTHTECIVSSDSEFTSQCQGTPANRTCYSRVNENGNVERGCANALDRVTLENCDSETCQTCIATSPPTSTGCNVGIFPPNRLFCHICHGGVNSTCSGVINSTMVVCPTYDPEDRCYVSRPNGNYERGCMSSRPESCEEEDRCFICSGQGCNLIDFNSAFNIHSGAKIIAFVAVIFSLSILVN